ncbi:hypothetical protein H4219_003668 [Mycoemilia scoparia]|uniref:Uncharacterized protein n=1 Tax=Mycoemilia scoparia TaxID=417184 RepID=A0A9W8DNY8_9FUNG|nr:hypothetical protein H4219_003668 [Mycoemilia scoparia]
MTTDGLKVVFSKESYELLRAYLDGSTDNDDRVIEAVVYIPYPSYSWQNTLRFKPSALPEDSTTSMEAILKSVDCGTNGNSLTIEGEHADNLYAIILEHSYYSASTIV